MLPETAKEKISSGAADAFIKEVLGIPDPSLQDYKDRLIRAVDSFCALYGSDRDVSVFSVGGRSEISGNHTDHNGGKVIAAAVNLDIISVAAARADGVIKVKSEGHREDVVTPDDTSSPDPSRYFHSSSLIAGICHAFRARGYNVGGFDAYTTSNE